MKTLLLVLLSILLTSTVYSQGYPPPTLIQKRFNDIKRIVQPYSIHLPDSVITFPITGLTNVIATIHGVEIELWIIDAKGKSSIILSSII
jgi:hypothetical protein